VTPSDTQGQRPEHGSEGHEDDPTGVRALLASLPDPGPMPVDLVRRIEARLAVEQAHREHGSPDGLGARSDSVFDLAAERSHRRPGRTVAMLGVAAAGLLVATVAIGELAGLGSAGGPSFDSAAQVPARTASGSDGGGSADGGGSEDGDSGGEAIEQDQAQAQNDSAGGDAEAGDGSGLDEETLAGDLLGEVVVLPELGTIDPEAYRDRILEETQDPEQASVTTGSLTAAGARSCWQRVDVSESWSVMRAAQARLDGERVVVLLGTHTGSTDAGQALVVPWSCTSGDDVEPLDTVTWPAP
jgi:hypothetical protein